MPKFKNVGNELLIPTVCKIFKLNTKLIRIKQGGGKYDRKQEMEN